MIIATDERNDIFSDLEYDDGTIVLLPMLLNLR